MSSRDLCPHCQSEMTVVFEGRRRTLISPNATKPRRPQPPRSGQIRTSNSVAPFISRMKMTGG